MTTWEIKKIKEKNNNTELIDFTEYEPSLRGKPFCKLECYLAIYTEKKIYFKKLESLI